MGTDRTDRPYASAGPLGSATSDSKESPMTPSLASEVEMKVQDAKSVVRITDGYEFDHFETINKIELYRASRFKSGDKDSMGYKKYFMNIVNAPAGNVTKNVDLDTADITVTAEDGGSAMKAHLYRVKLKQWLEENRIGILLNKIAENLPIYGQVILKNLGKAKIEFTPLRNLYRDPGILGIKNSLYCVEHHRLQPKVLKDKIKDGWDSAAVNKVIDAFFKSQDRQINVYEFYGWVQRKVVAQFLKDSGDEDEYVPVRAYIAMNVTVVASDPKEQNSFNEVLYAKKWDEEWPYKELNLFEIEGRALGLGIFEMLFDVQQRRNELANYKVSSTRISSKHIFQTRGNLVEKNILTDVEDGTILSNSGTEITPLATEERNLATYSQEENNLREIARELANSQEIVSGDLPSGTPYRLGLLVNQNASKLHEFIREKFGLFFEDVLLDWIIPVFEKEINDGFIMEVGEPELLERLIDEDINRRVNDSIKKYFLSSGEFPTVQEIDLMKQQMRKDYVGPQHIKVPEGFLSFGKKIHVTITGENANLKQQIESISNMIQLLAQNPTVMENPATAKLFSALMEKVGISPTMISKAAPKEEMPATTQLSNNAQEQGVNSAISAGTQGVKTGGPAPFAV